MQWTRGVVLFVGCAALVSACGGSEPFSNAAGRSATTGTAQAHLVGAVGATMSGRSARVSMTEHVTIGSEREDITGDGVMDLTHGAAALQLQVELGGKQEVAEMRIVDGAIYVKTGSDEWQSLRIAASGTAGSSDPTRYLSSLTAIAPDARAVGTDVVRGEPTTHYRGTVDITGALSDPALSAARRASLKAMSSLLGTKPMAIDAWIDRDGRLRKFSSSFQLADGLVQGMSAPVSASVSMELYDFGVDANVEKPVGAVSPLLDRAAQSDLRNGLTTEKTYYTDEMYYTASKAVLSRIEPSLQWGTKLHVVVSADRLSVCLDERSANGTTFALFDISAGANAGTYYAKVACPASIGAQVPAGFTTGGW